MKAAVVGHVEWVDFASVERVPEPGEIVNALENWAEAAGGGAMAARELLRLGAETTFFTVVGGDDFGRRAERALRTMDLRLELAVRAELQRRCFTFLDARGERTITTMGAKLVPRADDPFAWHELEQIDAVYFCGGDAGALRLARKAKALVATARELPTLVEAGVELDALVHSARDVAERYEPGDLNPRPKLLATTEGAAGGRFSAGGKEGRWAAAPLPGPLEDVYGAGESFAAALAYALGEGRVAPDALAFAAERSALAMTRRGGGSSA